MIDLDYLRALIEAIDESGVDSLEMSRAGTRLRISKSPRGRASAPAPPAQAQPPAPPQPAPAVESPPRPGDEGPSSSAAKESGGNGWVDVTSPMVGTFYRSPSPDVPPYVEVGGRVTRGQTLCILEAMKLMNELECELSGTVREICVENEEPVEYGQVLFRIEPEA